MLSRISSYIRSRVAATSLCAALMAVSIFLPTVSLAQSAAADDIVRDGGLFIGGSVYGGGAKAAVNTDNALLNGAAVPEGTVISAQALENLSVKEHDQDEKTEARATDVKIYDGVIKNVFGGGAMGRTFGVTNVEVNGKDVHVMANVFGAGEGQGAGVLGGSNVVMKNGLVDGSLYGGADAARTVGCSKVEVLGGEAIVSIFGGSRVANVYGNTFAFCNGKEATNDIKIGTVYGGNDVSGEISPANAADHPYWTWAHSGQIDIPSQLPIADADKTPNISAHPKDKITKEWNAYVYVSKPAQSGDAGFAEPEKKIEVTNIFVGGNGDYNYDPDLIDNPSYTEGVNDGKTASDPDWVSPKIDNNPYSGKTVPLLKKGYVQVEGGSVDNLYGGGNNATITESTDICLVNSTTLAKYVVKGADGAPLKDKDGNDSIRTHQFLNVYGGNNKAEMQIRPNWYLQQASIYNLYSGGNAGAMTFIEGEEEKAGAAGTYKAAKAGIFLTVESPQMTVYNVYGGCRKADVNPGNLGRNLVEIAPETGLGYDDANGIKIDNKQFTYATHVAIKDGNITNVYGGNDITGVVYHGCQVEILSTVHGNVYGGGNGSYVYTNVDNTSDLYYDEAQVLIDRATGYVIKYEDEAKEKGAEALNLWRPDARNTYVHVKGKSATDMTYIGGALYCGGNSATLRLLDGDMSGATAHLQLGSYVQASQLFLGSNGENMVSKSILEKYADTSVSTLNLNEPLTFARYMKGVEVQIRPSVGFDDGYADLSTWVGSLYLGGNVGSMSSAEPFTFDFNKKIVIYEKLVAGCNSANVPKTAYNAFFQGGIITPNTDTSKPKVKLDLSNIRLFPKRVAAPGSYALVDYYYKDDLDAAKQATLTDDDKKIRKGGNVYGGCYASGYVNGNVEINITENVIADECTQDFYPASQYNILSSRLSVYGGGYGLETEIWGDVAINVKENGQILKVFGGGEKGFVGKIKRYPATDTGIFGQVDPQGDMCDNGPYYKVGDYRAGTYVFKGYDSSSENPEVDYTFEKQNAHNTVVNAYNTSAGFNSALYNATCIYGGGYEGIVTGNSTVNLGRTYAHTVFGGACNADIYGYSTLNIGVPVEAETDFLPTIQSNAYGANDFGGRILGRQKLKMDNSGLDVTGSLAADVTKSSANSRLRVDASPTDIYAQAYVVYHKGTIKGNIFGGPCGAYKYARTYSDLFLPNTGGDLNKLVRRDGMPFYLPSLTINMAEKLAYGEKALGINTFVNIVTAENTAGYDVEGGNLSSLQYVYDADGYTLKPWTSGEKAYYPGKGDMAVKTVTHDGGIFGAGEGLLGREGLADVHSSYVRLAVPKTVSRANPFVKNIFGGGYCSKCDIAQVDAFNGKVERIFGGSYGMEYESRLCEANQAYKYTYDAPETPAAEKEKAAEKTRLAYLGVRYACEDSRVYVHNIINPDMDVFGAGCNAGSNEGRVELYAGRIRDAYGASKDEGYTCASNVYVPKGSTTLLENIYGGAFGKSKVYMCDVSNTFVAYNSEKATVTGAVYGGNNNQRVTRSANVSITVPVYNNAAATRSGNPSITDLAEVFGAGNGEGSVASFTNVDMHEGAFAKNVYGGGNAGDVLGDPFLLAYTLEKGDKVPVYDVETNKWDIYEGDGKYFSDATYKEAQEDANYAIMMPLPGEEDYDLTKLPTWERVPSDVQDKVGSAEVPGPVLHWPGFAKYKYAPQTFEYHRWTLQQQCKHGRVNDVVFIPERGEPGDPAYTPAKSDIAQYPAYYARGFSFPRPMYELGMNISVQRNAKVRLLKGSVVRGSVYGGGYGTEANVAGSTEVKLVGGEVQGNIYGGGCSGTVMPTAMVRTSADDIITCSTNVLLGGGSVTNSYGGGKEGPVYGIAYTTVGYQDVGEGDYYGSFTDVAVDEKPVQVDTYKLFPSDVTLPGNLGSFTCDAVEIEVEGVSKKTYPRISSYEILSKTSEGGLCKVTREMHYQDGPVFTPRCYTQGDPCVLRSIYGGGEKGKVDCMTSLVINQGHIGFKYDAASASYVENLDLKVEGDTILKNNGNAFGGGYGEGAYTFYPTVWMYGGTIRNSLYGGGEIASVGLGPTIPSTPATTPEEEIKRAFDIGEAIRDENTAPAPGYSHVIVMNGKIQGDVFGGGRGFSYDETGNTQGGKKLYSDGYVFGNTSVFVRGGTIGTDQTLHSANAQGNVFGGGNIGFVYTGAIKCAADNSDPYWAIKSKLTGDASHYLAGRYYTNMWKCKSCGAITKSYLEPHACWACQRHRLPIAIHDYTTFDKANTNGFLALSEDTRVVVSPYSKVTADSIEFAAVPVTAYAKAVEARTFHKGDYVPTNYLNTLKNKTEDAAQWAKVDNNGVVIRNAVFAGGNVTSGSDQLYANQTTVFGNSSAALNDIFFRDFITLGEEKIGGLYGDGNLTFVNGYRELNITNYGTDFYNMSDNITEEEYKKLSDRERDYYKMLYECKTGFTAASGKVYVKGDRIEESEYQKLKADEKLKFQAGGFCTIYAGRSLNTIQRADFCGVFGSRLILEGAADRVVTELDYHLYTINRVGELSLNKSAMPGYNPTKIETKMSGDELKEHNSMFHGNYFGIYSVVKYLGNLTSDVDFDDVRFTENTNEMYKADITIGGEPKKYGVAKFSEWKKANIQARSRNNGTCRNKVALASGVYLEVVREPKTSGSKKSPAKKDAQQQSDEKRKASSNDEGESFVQGKEYGYITGVIELDLVNVATGVGGGYVYAKNEHGVRTGSSTIQHTNLSEYNEGAVTELSNTYADAGADDQMETSGNFIHSTKQIVDDCYPNVSAWQKSVTGYSPAHYWYVKGQIYVYDQYVSAYTGSNTAYTESTDIPLTITLGSRGTMKLIDIQPNLYAYYKRGGSEALGADGTDRAGNKTYKVNDEITYWDWSLLTPEEQKMFVPTTYVAVQDYVLGDGTTVPKGTVWLPADYEAIKDGKAYAATDTEKKDEKKVSDFVGISNEIDHNNGYAVSVALNNPYSWNTFHTRKTDGGTTTKITDKKFQALIKEQQAYYVTGPTYSPTVSGVYGQREYEQGNVIASSIWQPYRDNNIKDKVAPEQKSLQAEFESCYVAIAPVVIDGKNIQAGVGISRTEYAALDDAVKTNFDLARVCISTFQVNSVEWIYNTELVSTNRINILQDEYKRSLTEGTEEEKHKKATEYINAHFESAYICTKDGLCGGTYFENTKNYNALDSWAALTAADRTTFKYNYDALDIISLSNTAETGVPAGMYPGYLNANNSVDGYMGGYDTGWTGTAGEVYNVPQLIDYQAKYVGTATLDYDHDTKTVVHGQTIDREEFEKLPNEKAHYTTVNVETADVRKEMYFITERFFKGDHVYVVGDKIDLDTYNSFSSEQQAKVSKYQFQESGKFYFCREEYTVGERGDARDVTPIQSSDTTHVVDPSQRGTTITTNGTVPVGTVITDTNYGDLINKQKNFTIVGEAPKETTTLYVSRDANIDNLSTDKVITLIYQYEYDESDASGENIETFVERHIINVHLQFKSGKPTVGPVDPPAIVLPGTAVGLKVPYVTEGAYEIIGGGWEMYETADDALNHKNGKPYKSNADPIYWYQDGHYVAYYATSYLGKSYSNAVQFSVANYHDINDVVNHENFMYIDNPTVKRKSKIYLDDRVCYESDGVTEKPNTSELDLLQELFMKSLNGSTKEITEKVQKKDGGNKPLYYRVGDDGKPTDEETTTYSPYPVYKETTKEVPIFDDHVRNCNNLEFFFNTDVDHKGTADWEPIGNDDAYGCFSGVVHGMGHTVGNLQTSLFGSLCGSVYNLGVTGTFTTAGIADASAPKSSFGCSAEDADASDDALPSGEKDTDPQLKDKALVANCWVVTSNDAAKTKNPVFNYTATNTAPAGWKHLINCYYPTNRWDTITKAFSATFQPYNDGNTDTYGKAYARSLSTFANGEVAHSLNGYYLVKRYADEKWTSAGTDMTPFKYIKYTDIQADGKATLTDGYYNKQEAGYPFYTYIAEKEAYSYVERQWKDGDLIYRYGEIPTNDDVRMVDEKFYPIYPDDYLFFGQTLTYGYDEKARPYTTLPDAVNKQMVKYADLQANLLVRTDKNNIVNRAPGYFRNSLMDMVYFNDYAVFADAVNVSAAFTETSKKLFAGMPVHHNLTAFDLTGYNDNTWQLRYAAEDTEQRRFYPPVLDFSTLKGLDIYGLTQNLLAYSPDADADYETYSTTFDYFVDKEPAYSETNALYRNVPKVSASAIAGVKGHLVLENSTSGAYVSPSSHFLVDRQDYNAPIAYTLGSGCRIWYQRTPDNYVNENRGWEAVSLPFVSEIVSTHTKGEITHFYKKSPTAPYAQGYDSGHEYWLRQYEGGKADAASVVFTAFMNHPAAIAGGVAKDDANYFLWDYYYSANDSLDANKDYYTKPDDHRPGNKTYYSATRVYNEYAFAQAAMPYIVGFPGDRYYEFDLSGTFVPEHTNTAIAKLEAQTITFASKEAAAVAVSDDELDTSISANTADGYSFVPTYLNHTVPTEPAGADEDYYLLNSAPADASKPSSFDVAKIMTDKKVGAFRPYFKKEASGKLKAPQSRSIVFGTGGKTELGEEQPIFDAQDSDEKRGLHITAKKQMITVESDLAEDCDIRIVSAGGQLYDSYTICPGEKVETRVAPGVYIVNRTKLIVR